MNEQAHLDHLKQLWNKNWPEAISKEPVYPLGEILLSEYLKLWAEATPDKPALIYYGTEVTFRELDDLSSRFASLLQSKGLKKGDRVAVYLGNCPQFYIAFHGILKCGCVHVPVNPMFKKAELLYELNDSDARVIVALDHSYSVIQGIRTQTALVEVVTTHVSDFLPQEPTIPIHPSLQVQEPECPDSVDLMSALAMQNPQFQMVDVSLDDLAALNYTGGTTGLPKGCEHTQRNMLYAVACTLATIVDSGEPPPTEGAMLTYLPPFWIAGEVGGIIGPIMTNLTVVLLARWDMEAVLTAIDKYHVLGLSGTIENYLDIMALPDLKSYDLSSLRSSLAMSFVKKLTPEIRRQWGAMTGLTLKESAYGMTETHTMDTFTNGMQQGDMDLNSKPIFCGIPMPGTQIKIVDFSNRDLLPLGTEGEIVIKSPSLMRGYWKNPEASQKDIIDGWFHTGDIGMLDEDGYLHYLGRTKEMLKMKGMSIFPSEIESLLAMHPAIEASGVIGRNDPEKGEVPVAFVKLDPAYVNQITEDDIVDWCRENMSVYKVPEIKIVDSFPMTDTGKVRKVTLMELL